MNVADICVDIRLTGIVHKTVVDAVSHSKRVGCGWGGGTGIMGWCFRPKGGEVSATSGAERESIPVRVGGY